MVNLIRRLLGLDKCRMPCGCGTCPYFRAVWRRNRFLGIYCEKGKHK